MNAIRRVDPLTSDQLVYDSIESGGRRVPAILFIIGVLVIVLNFSGTLKRSDDVAGVLIAILIVFSPFVAAIALALLWCRGFIVDRAAKTVTTWWGFGFRFSSTTQKWQTGASVEITSRTNKGSRTFFVELGGLQLWPTESEIVARQLAAEIAKFVELDLVDRSRGTKHIREAGRIEESLREQQARDPIAVADAPVPKEMRSRVSVQGENTTIHIPAEKFQPTSFVPVAMLMFFVSAIICRSWLQSPDLATRIFTATLIAGINGSLLLYAMYRAAVDRNGVVVNVSPRELRIAFGRGGGNPVAVFPVQELQELRMENDSKPGDSASRPALAAMSSKQIIRFGHGLSIAELEWIRSIIMKACGASGVVK